MAINRLNILRFSGILLLISTGCSSMKGERSDSLYTILEEVEIVSRPVDKDVLSTAPTYSFDDDKLKTMGVTDLTDALHRMPGLNIRDYGGAGGMKTVSVRGLGSSHTGVVYDGVALSDAQNGQIDLSRYSLDNVDEMALVIGDNNDIFSSARASASAASIVLNTGSVPSELDSLWKLTGQLRVGSFGLVNPYIKIGKSLNRKLSFSVIGEYAYALNNYPFTLKNGIQVTRERRENSRMNSGHGELNFRWRVAQGSALNGKIYYYDNDRQLPGPVVLYNTKSDDTLHDRNLFGQLIYSNSSLNKWKFRAVGKFNWDSSFYHEVDGKYSGGFKDESYFQREIYFAGAIVYTPVNPVSISYCTDYFYNNLTSNDPKTVGPWRHSILNSFSAKFRNSRLQLIGRLLCSVYLNGVRMGESTGDRAKLSPSLSLSVQPFTASLFFMRCSYKNIFRMPTFNESYYYRLGSLALKPETTDQINFGLTWQLNPHKVLSLLTLTCDVYYNAVKDKIVAIPMNMYVWAMTNLDKVRAFGADITFDSEITLEKSQHILLTANYSWQRVQPRTAKSDPDYNKQVAYIPVHSGAASITWQNPWVDLGIKANACGERYGTNSNIPSTRIKGYVDAGAFLMRKFSIRSHSVDLRLDLLNLFDTQYEIVASYPMPGRSFRCTCTFNL